MEFPNVLSYEQAQDLERVFSKDEIKQAVWDYGLDKSPSPDGFTFGFYHRFWSLLEDEVVDAVCYFFNNGFYLKGINSSFIALIPKSQGADMVKDFRPISLIGSIYKIIAKLLANRLVTVLDGLPNEVQSAFIANRQILDGPFMLNELIHWCKVKKTQSMIFKVNFEKAFDSVCWDFLDDILKKFRFGSRWRDWIQSCLNSSRGSLLVNGSPILEFQFSKGFKQGDPLSPLLFILVMKSLHLSFQNVVNAGLFKGVVLDSFLQTSHLFYADDVVFIGQWVLKSLFSYLGVNIGGHMTRIKSWDVVINKVLNRLSKWKMNVLSTGGRLMLLKSGLGLTPIYYMSMAIMAIHGDDGKLGNPNKYSFPSNWIDIIRAIHLLNNKGIDLLSFVNKKIGNGKNLGGEMQLLSLYFLEFMLLSRLGSELSQMASLQSYLEGIILPNLLDRWVWSLLRDGEFFVSSARNLIDDKTLGMAGSKTQWCKFVSIKANILSWRVKLNNLPTRLNLSRRVITEYLVNISKRRAFGSLNEDILKITILTTNTPYPSRKIRRIRACTHQRPQRKPVQRRPIRHIGYIACEYSGRYQTWRHFKALSLDKLRSPDFNSFSNQEYSEEEVAETMAETMKQYMSKTRDDYGSGVARPKIEDKDNFELKGQFLKELRTNTFSGSDHEDANEHIEKVLEIVDLFHIQNITIDQVMLRAFPMSLTGSGSRWLRNEPTGSIITWDGLKTKFLNKYCLPARTA
ncbi:RNA-directed DNA polymerase, eukaryota [Tanacetum coccineum]